MAGEDFKRLKEKGITLLESMMATAIVAIGFIAVFQMVNYSVHSIDVSGERTKANYLVSMIAEDIIGDKNTTYADKKKFKDALLDGRDSDKFAWKMDKCSAGVASSGSYTNAYDNKTKNKWTNRFSKRRLKCASDNDTKMLSVFDICSSIAKGVNSPNCDYKTNDPHFMQSTGDGVMIIGKMQVNMNNQRVKKVLYFQID